MVVDQRTLRANMLRSKIGSNVFNKLTGQQAQTQQTTPTVQQTTDTPITQSRGLQQTTQQQPEVYKVITNKFPTYDVKDLMGFGPQAVKNQLGFANTVSQYNRLQTQANANTDPNVRYNLTKPELTNKQTLQIQQATPETNEQGLKINKTNSFKDLVIDLKNGADQGGSLNFMKFRDLYPEYVENWDEVLDLYESIKANPAYTTEQITQNAQKQYPELFGINENYSDKDKMTALKRLYDEMVSNKQNGIQLTQQDIIDRYPEYANTEDINTVMELQDFINKDKKSTPTFIDVYDISDQFKSLTKGNVEVGNTEKEQISNDLKSLDKIDANIYNYLSEEGQDYVKTLALAKEIGDMVRKDYRVPDNISDYDLLMKVKDEMPEVYSELTKGLNITNEISDYDRKIFEGKTTGKKFAQQSIKKIGGNLMAVLGPDAVKGLGILSNRLGDLVESGLTGISNKLENATGNRGIFENTEGISEGSHALGDTLIRASGWLKEDLESQDRYQEFLQEQGAEKAKGAGINFKGYKNALKEGDMKGVRDTFVKDVNEAKDLGWGTWLSKNLGSLGYLLPSMFAGTKAEMFLSFLPSGVGRAYEDYANDEGIKANLTDKQIQDRAILAGGLESLIEVMETPFRKGKRGSFMENFPGMRNAIVRTIMMTEKGAVGEGLEEVAQEFSNRLIAKASGSERDLGTLDEYLDIFAETVSSSQIVSLLGGSAEGIDQQKLNNLEQQIAEDTEYRNKILEGQAFVANDFNEYANAVEVVPGTTTEELQQVWNNAQQKKQELEEKANGITSNSYNNVNVPNYERTTVKENEQPKLSAKDSQEYTDLLDEMEKNGEITKEDRKKAETELGIFTRNVEQPKTEGLANIQKTNETKSETSTEEKRNIIDRIVDKGASIVTRTVSAQDKLYKAQEPRMNVLSNKKNLENRRANSDRANELIVENGFKPTNTEERLNAHQKTLNNLWKKVKAQIDSRGGIKVDQSGMIKALQDYINEKKSLNIAAIESDIKALERELEKIKSSQKRFGADLPTLENRKQVYNDLIDWKNQEASEVYKGGLKLLTREIGKIEDNILSQVPGEFSKLKKDVGALLDTYEDVFKAHMKNQRSKGIGLTETYSRIEGIGDMLQGIIGVFKGEGGKVISGAGKVLLGKSLARAKDVDFLIKKGFEDLSNEMGSNNKNDNDTTTDKNDNPPTKPNEQENKEQKPQTQSETEKKSEKKTDKTEQVQAKKKNNQNTRPKTKGLAKINETKEETKTEGLANVSKKQTEEKHFTYDEYGEVMDKIEAVQKQINEKLDKQYEQERADLLKRFNELSNKDNKTDAEGKELQQLASQLNNLTNKYDRLKEEELAKQAPELLEQEAELQKAFDRDWTAMIDEKMNEINKPYNDLREEYQEKIRKELGLPENTRLTEKIYKGLTAEELEKVSKIQKEYEEKVKKLENKTEGLSTLHEDAEIAGPDMSEKNRMELEINRIMTMDEAKKIIEMAWNANNLRDFYDGEYNNAEEWIRGQGEDEVGMYIENTYASQKMIESHQEILDGTYTIYDVLENYLKGTLTGKEDVNTKGQIDLSKDTGYEGSKFYEPQKVEEGKELWDKANQRVTKSNQNEIYRARADFIINSHTDGYIDSLGLDQAEVNKKIMQWTAYPATAKALSEKINKGVALENKWTGLENSSIVHNISITDDELKTMVKEVKGNSQEYERKYIVGAMLALDTHIDRSNLTFDFVDGPLTSHRGHRVLGNYNHYNDVIKIAESGQNTVAHEMGHHIDYLRCRQLFGLNQPLSLGFKIEGHNLTEDQKAFVNHFNSFMKDLTMSADLRSEYTMDSSEILARFVGRFTEWTKNKATNGRYGFETKWYNDNYKESQFIEFANLLQEKGKLDVENNYPNYEKYLNNRKPSNKVGGQTIDDIKADAIKRGLAEISNF